MIEIDRFHWNLARAFFSLSAVCATIGVIGNFLIFMATCGTLIQLPLLFDVYLEMDSEVCDAIMFLPEMGIAIGGTCILCIGLDRMISVKFPARYKIFDKRFYYLFFASLMAAYCCYLCFIMTLFRQQKLVVCEVVSPYPNDGVVWFNYFNVSVNLASFIVYSITFKELRTQACSFCCLCYEIPQKNTDALMMKRIGKSLFIIVAVDFGGWVLTPGTIIFLHQLNLTNEQLFAWTYLCTIFINVSLAIKSFIYYRTSSDYRCALRSLLGLSPLSTSYVMTTTTMETAQ
ncbi:hypothetical protein PRIPAC_81940 [Pristionchus pacificus]|uniref:G protein-coupled receptor n=1 Tax=Pristionchus pacificus TaxID=54126 RepID=A0A2A6CPX0_PRIPA|nr:hypothetical protein PRIPAC_81940 [Pristionchus pacificus]|eukprot:PDM80146.1 G protein-coupled receptor [Pristionchus pacificus]